MSPKVGPEGEYRSAQHEGSLMTAPLPAPTPQLARRILATCPYVDRLPAGRFTPRLGIARGTVRGLPELHLYLAPDDRTLPALNLERLADWIDAVVADADLAQATRHAARAADSYVNACIATHALVGARVEQARTTLALAANGAAESGKTPT